MSAADPRFRQAMTWAYDPTVKADSDEHKDNALGLLHDLDSVDRNAGVIRVDTNDEATVERIENVLRGVMLAVVGSGFDAIDRHIGPATRAVLAALREAGAK